MTTLTLKRVEPQISRSRFVYFLKQKKIIFGHSYESYLAVFSDDSSKPTCFFNMVSLRETGCTLSTTAVKFY